MAGYGYAGSDPGDSDFLLLETDPIILTGTYFQTRFIRKNIYAYHLFQPQYLHCRHAP